MVFCPGAVVVTFKPLTNLEKSSRVVIPCFWISSPESTSTVIGMSWEDSALCLEVTMISSSVALSAITTGAPVRPSAAAIEVTMSFFLSETFFSI